jgi:hypothetical protein
MNVRTFKNLIKEAVAEAVREELSAILLESPKKQVAPLKENRTISLSTNDVPGVADARASLRAKMGNMFGLNQPASNNYQSSVPLEIDKENDNPYMSFIMDAAANMTPQDKAGLNNLG